MQNFEMLKKNTSVYENITCINSAIWGEKTALNLRDVGRGEWGYVVEFTEEVSNTNVTTVTMEELVDIYDLEKIDILKIDIEGSEKELFDLSDCKWLNLVRVLIIELHDNFKPGSSKAVFNKLEELTYTLSISGENLVFYFVPDGSDR